MTEVAIKTEHSDHSRPAWIVIGLLLVVHAVLSVDTARQMSVTHDEYWHLPVGLLNLKTGRFDYDNLNPPLVRMWCALPLAFTSAEQPATEPPTDPTGYGDRFQKQNQGELQRLFLIGRCMIVLLSVLTGLLLAYWAGKIFGIGSACLTALLWSISPTVIANASLVTTDLGAAAFFVLTLYLLWKFAGEPGYKNALLFGLALGAAQLVKYTCLLLLPLSIVLWFVVRFRNRELTPSSKTVIAKQWIAGLLLSLCVLNAGYFFRGSFSSLESYQFRSTAMAGISDRLKPIGITPVPLPKDYLEGIDRQRQIMEGQHPVFLDNQWSTEGYGHYYLMTLLYKLPHAMQLLILLTVVFLVLPRREARLPRVQLFLLLPVLSLIAVASLSGMQLGLRYILPAFPFLFLFVGQSARWIHWRKYRLRTIGIALGTATLLLSLRYHPHHLAYFNESAGGPVAGRKHLLDSNLDWGQDLAGVKEYVESHNIEDLHLAYFGTLAPDEFGLRYRLPPVRQPQPGWYAISVNYVQGRPHVVRDETGQFQPVGLDAFGYFRFFEPKACIGYSIDLYHLTEFDILEWRGAMLKHSRQLNP